MANNTRVTNKSPADAEVLSTTITTITQTTDSAGTDDDSNRAILIGAIIGGLILITILLLVFLYIYKKNQNTSFFRKYANRSKESRRKKFNFYANASTVSHLPPQPSQLGYENEALQQSNQDIEVGSSQHEDIDLVDGKTKLYLKDSLPVDGYDTGVYDESFDVSIKLLTPWDEIYNDHNSKQCHMMQDMVENEIEELYINYDDFREVNVTKFRQGSVICDLKIIFAESAIDPLGKLQNAVMDGLFKNLQTDRSFFIDWRKIGTDVDINTSSNVVSGAVVVQRVKNDNDSFSKRENRIESGYGSQYFDPKQVVDKLTHNPKFRENSQKSVISVDSVISENGTSESVSPKSSSSTNLSIHEEKYQQDKNSLKRKLFKKSKGKFSYKKHCDNTKENAIIGKQHLCMFDFSPQDERELALKQDEVVTVTHVSNGGWVKVVNLSKKHGWVPHNFLVQVDATCIESTKKAVESIIYFDQVIDSLDSPSIPKLDSPVGHMVKPEIPPRLLHSNDSTEDESDPDYEELEIEDDITGLFVTVFPFEPSDIKELSIEIGDVIDVLQTSESGWWKGRSLRTYTEGWFPSSYVKPQSADIDFTKYLAEEDKGTVSDSEIQLKNRSSVKSSTGYNSDDGRSTAKVSNKEKETRLNREEVLDSSLKKRILEIADDTEYDYRKGGGFRPLYSVPKDISKSENFINSQIDEPAKPVPPKPRKRHMQEVIRTLAAEGKLGSTESLIRTQSNEYLAPHNRLNNKTTAGQARRNSDGYFEDDETVVRRRYLPTGRIDRIRPRSFQETPKSSFLFLANKYAESMKPAWSLPALNIGAMDQVKLSPDDERPYLEPIPRKSKHAVIQGLKDQATGKTQKVNRSINEPVKSRSPLRKAVSEGYVSKPLPPSPLSQRSASVSNQAHRQKPKITAEKPAITKRVAAKKLNTKRFIEEQLKRNNEKASSGRNSIGDHMLPPRSSNPRLRANHRHFASHESTIFEESEQLNSPNSPNDDNKTLMTRSQEDLSIFNRIDKNSSSLLEEPSTTYQHRRYHSDPYQGDICVLSHEKMNDMSPVSEHNTVDLRIELTGKNEVISTNRSLQKQSSDNHENEMNLHEEQNNEIKVDIIDKTIDNNRPISPHSRTSSIQSLSSIGSSYRSTASSKHEQMNLRRAIVNVYGQGANDLSFKIGSIIYELRPRNKDGLCFGLLEDSTQGWYPAESVESFS